VAHTQCGVENIRTNELCFFEFARTKKTLLFEDVHMRSRADMAHTVCRVEKIRTLCCAFFKFTRINFLFLKRRRQNLICRVEKIRTLCCAIFKFARTIKSVNQFYYLINQRHTYLTNTPKIWEKILLLRRA